MTQYFADCKTLDELRIAYLKLSAIHHPDIGGDVATMQAINAEHDRVFEALKAAHNASADEYHQTTETPEEFRRAELITKRPAMKWITSMDYKRAARDAMKKTFGFAPALKNIIPMEGEDNGEIVTSVAFCIAATGKGYSWQVGGEVERAEAYDI